MELYDVVTTLVGPINPVGETHTDEARYENLKDMILLVDQLLTDIDRVAMQIDRKEASIQKAARRAAKLFDDLGIKE